MRNFSAVATLILCCLPSGPAAADCKNPAGSEGEIIYNGDYHLPQVCTGTVWVALGVLNPGAGGSGCLNPAGVEGDILYNADVHKPQYCDGDDWIAMIGTVSSGSSCTAPTLCPNVGDICDDGNAGNNPDPKFAGWLVYANSGNCEPLYVTQSNQSTSSKWKTSNGTNDIANDSTEDGKINDGQVANSTDFPAFKLCKDLTDGGYDDWYLPARTELDLLWRNSAAIGGFTTDYYWSSSESTISFAWYQIFYDGNQGSYNKPSDYDVRCVRRD